jgi:cytochrome P450
MPAEHVELAALDGPHHAVLAELRAVGPVVWVPALDGWLVTTRDVAVAVMRDATTFTVDDPRFSTAQVVGTSMLSLDGPAHTRHRTPFADPLRPGESTARFGDRIDALAVDLVRGLAANGEGELRRELAGPLAVAVSSMVLGLDDVAAPVLLAMYDRIVAAVDGVSRGLPVSDDGREAFDSLSERLLESMRRDDSLLQEVSASLTPNEVVSNAAVFLFGGIETSEGMTSNLLLHLLGDPTQWAAVTKDRSLVDAAVEESLRLEPAATRVDRYATVDVEIGDAHVRAGDLVIVSLAAANRDPSVYPDPDRFDVQRANARTHVAFAHGPHACLGAQLARLQTRAAVHAVIDHLPGIALASEPQVAGVIFRKPLALHATWTVV